MTARCTRFEEEALLRIEEGLPLDVHFSECADCRAAQASYSRMERALRASRGQPRRGWHNKVLAAIDHAPAAAARSWRRRAAWAAGAVAAAVTITLLPVASLRSPAGPSISARVVPGERQTVQLLRGDSPHAGDILQLNAAAGGARFAELRIYREDRELVLQCAPPASMGAVSCARSGDALEARLRLPSRGSFQALIAASGEPLPPPTGSLAEDTARLLRAHARIKLSPPVRAY